MARPLRIEFPGAFYYLVARADRRDVLYRDAGDYWRFLGLLGQVCRRYRFRCHAYCLLPTRYVLVLETPQSNLARGLRQLNGLYAQAYNRRHGVSGHLFAGRYQSLAFDPGTLLLQACRETLRTSVTRGTAEGPEHWRWCSFEATFGAGPAPGETTEWLKAAELLPREVAGTLVDREAFRRAVCSFDPHPVFDGAHALAARLHDGVTAGTAAAPRLEPRRDPALRRLLAGYADRDDAMRHAYATGQYTLKQIATHFGVHYATVSRAVTRVQA